MAQAKKKNSTKTAKKTTARSTKTRRSSCARTSKKAQGISSQEKMHIYIVTAMSIIAGILLCADAAMMMV